MKLQTIVEAGETFAELVKKLNGSLHQKGERELQPFVTSPRDTVELIRVGALAKTFVLNDKNWVEKFLIQWHTLDEKDRIAIFEKSYAAVIKHIEQMKAKAAKEDIDKSDLVLSEGIGGFLATLAKWSLMIMKLLATSGGGGGYGGYGRGGGKSIDDFRMLNPFAVNSLTARLFKASQHASVKTPPTPPPGPTP